MEIICKGVLTPQGDNKYKADVNYSDIFSFLIRKVGTKVSHYNSDLFYDLKEIYEAITKVNPESESFLIGLRESGVDGTYFVKAKLADPWLYGDPYIKIYSVDIKADLVNREIVIVLSTVR